MTELTKIEFDVPDIITCWNHDKTEIIRIAPDGRVFWKQREVETDDDFRSAMLDLAEALKKVKTK